MRKEKYVLKMNDEMHNLILESLIEMKNRLQAEGSYTDAVDEAIVKYLKAWKKKKYI